MFKWLLLFVGAGLLYFWLKKKTQVKFEREKSSNPKTDKAQKLSEPEVMVQCQYCKVHLPQADALAHDGRFYCSNEHLHSLDQRGWIGAAVWRHSPNQDVRPEDQLPDLVVIHHISLPPGQFKSQDSSCHIIDFFQNQLDPSAHPYFAEIASQKVSSHFLITRSGELIQFVSTQNKSWHAGVSSFMGREKCNDFSIGIELEGDGESVFEEAQYKALAVLISQVQSRYPNLQFAGHSDIAPDRKADPGIFFDWKKFQKETGISSKSLPYGTTSR